MPVGSLVSSEAEPEILFRRFSSPGESVSECHSADEESPFVMCRKNRCFARAQRDIQVICSIAMRSRVRCRICLINFAVSGCCRETAERLTQTARSRRQSATRSQRPGRRAQGPWHDSCKNKFLAGGRRMDGLDLTLNRKENSYGAIRRKGI